MVRQGIAGFETSEFFRYFWSRKNFFAPGGGFHTGTAFVPVCRADLVVLLDELK